MISMIWKSFYDENAYRRALDTWRWKFPLYFLMLCAVFALAVSLPVAKRINAYVFDSADFIISQIPDGKIKNGRFTMSAPSPHFVKLKNGQNFMAFSEGLLDSNQTEGLFMSLEKDRITVYGGPDYEEYFFLSDIEKQVKEASKGAKTELAEGIPVNGAALAGLLPTVRILTFMCLPAFMFCMAAVMLAIIAFSLSLPVFIASLSIMPGLRYVGALKIALLAATPAMVFFALELALGYNSFGGFIYMLLCFVIAWRVMRRLARRADAA